MSDSHSTLDDEADDFEPDYWTLHCPCYQGTCTHPPGRCCSHAELRQREAPGADPGPGASLA